jgi:hypothetical protein
MALAKLDRELKETKKAAAKEAAEDEVSFLLRAVFAETERNDSCV